MNIIADKWKDYEILDAGDGMKLERWKNVILSRPDPQVIWKPVKPELWAKANAKYNRSTLEYRQSKGYRRVWSLHPLRSLRLFLHLRRRWDTPPYRISRSAPSSPSFAAFL